MSFAPILYLPHGGGPLPLLEDPGHAELSHFLQTLPQTLPRPEAILMISAHWEAEVATITSGSHPELIYDYHGFPPESYEIKYPAPGHPELATEVIQRLEAADIPTQADAERGFDHGMFVPLKLMYPEAEIPVIQLSLVHGLDPELHLQIGQALAPLREKNILIVGSGMSFHNMRAFFNPSQTSQKAGEDFDNWLNQICVAPEMTPEERGQGLSNWLDAPQARFVHPREEHLLPLQVCYGMAMATTPQADNVFKKDLLGHRISAFLWHKAA